MGASTKQQREAGANGPDERAATPVRLLTRSDVRAICTSLHISPTKTLGQNFVHDGGTVRKIVRAAQVTPGEHVLEVGPGLGSLTLGLLDAGARVSAVEIDPLLATALPATVRARGGRDLRVLQADALSLRSAADLDAATPIAEDTQPHSWGPPTKLVANLPYNVAAALVLAVLERFETIEEILVMVQTEVAQRLSAAPGSRIYGVPSVKVAWYGDAEPAGAISRNVFWPTPHVDSALVRIRRTAQAPAARAEGAPAAAGTGGDAAATDSVAAGAGVAVEVAGESVVVERADVFALVDAAFAQRRKSLRAALKHWAGPDLQAADLLEQAGIDPLRRGETLDLTDFLNLAAVAKRARAGVQADASGEGKASDKGDAQ